MSEIHWVKLSTAMFDDEKIKVIRSMPSGNDICLIWIQLISLAGRVNDNGQIYITEDVPYTDTILANSIGHPIETVRLALATFQKMKMLTILANDRIALLNWGKHQNIEGMERFRELSRARTENYRKRLAAVGGDSYRQHTSLVMARDGNRCVYCGSEENLVLDHLIPLLKGGDNEPCNLVAACRKCNSGKAGNTIEESGYSFLNPNTKKMYEDLKSRRHAVTVRDHVELELDSDIDSEEDKIAPKRSTASAPKPVTYDFTTGLFSGVTDEMVATWQAACPAVSVDREIVKAAQWLLANPTKRKKNYRRFLLNWIMRAQERGKG